ncbi:MAG: hypothetical protein DMF68_07300 [Acidobacteria bacterium]|nr:MAG: hypothetical protein DMF68_07300 [Acidobacteriota bacterium]
MFGAGDCAPPVYHPGPQFPASHRREQEQSGGTTKLIARAPFGLRPRKRRGRALKERFKNESTLV